MMNQITIMVYVKSYYITSPYKVNTTIELNLSIDVFDS